MALTSNMSNVMLRKTADRVVSSPVGGVAATNVQAAIQELDAEKAPVSTTYTKSEIDTAMALKAPKDSPTFSGQVKVISDGIGTGSQLALTRTSAGKTRYVQVGGSGELFFFDSAGSSVPLTITDTRIGVGTTSPQATLHSTGTTILGCAGVTLSSIGTLQLSIGFDQSNNRLQFQAKKEDGTCWVGYLSLLPA